jgi:hypothetical protein
VRRNQKSASGLANDLTPGNGSAIVEPEGRKRKDAACDGCSSSE